MWTLIVLATTQIARHQFTASKTALTCHIKRSSSLPMCKSCKQSCNAKAVMFDLVVTV